MTYIDKSGQKMKTPENNLNKLKTKHISVIKIYTYFQTLLTYRDKVTTTKQSQLNKYITQNTQKAQQYNENIV